MSETSSAQDDDPWVALVRRDLLAVLRRAGACVRQAPLTPDNIHKARRCFKEAAALLRLIEAVDDVRSRAFVGEVRRFRRQLGAARDLDVIEQTFEPFAAAVPVEISVGLRRKVMHAKRQMSHAMSTPAGEIGRGVRELSSEVSLWDLSGADASSLIATLRRSYRRARRLGEPAIATLDRTDLHEFRKAAIVFREQLAPFRPAWPKLVDAWCAELQSLRNRLGRLNDLALLRDFAADLPRSMQLAEAIAAAHADTARLIEPAWRRLFSESSRRMAERLESWIGSPKRQPETSEPGEPQEAAKTSP